MTRLSPRLEATLQFTNGFTVLIDIGTDHAKLPIAAVSRGFVERAIAVDNKQGPLENARKSIKAAKLDDKISTILADGFPVQATYDVATILGLGGIAIKAILENAPHDEVKRLILAPNSEAQAVRLWLVENGYSIIAEAFLEDDGKHYQIIVAEPGIMSLSSEELEFGPLILQDQNQAFTTHIHKLTTVLETAAANATDPEERLRLETRVRTLKGLIR